MPDNTPIPEEVHEPETEVRLRAQILERELTELRQKADQRVIHAELKVEALRAGMVDLDGLKLIDLAALKLNESGSVEGASDVMSRLKAAKPWLFGGGSSSSAAQPPPAQPPRQKLATEMTDAEYQAARTALLKRHSSFS